jgi:predicted phosphoribosyltransferase
MQDRQDGPGRYSWRDHSPRYYEDRKDAGKTLGAELARYRQDHPLVLGIPRGGVPIAAEVAALLDGDLDVIVARKIGAPAQQELALGAITADGTRVLNDRVVDILSVPRSYIERVSQEQQAEAQRREHRFRAGMDKLSVRGRVVILVDDGLATGATMRACIAALKGAGTKRLVVAVPVGAAEACDEIAATVDELVCPLQPDPFYAVGAHYHEFGQVSDDEVEEILRERRRRRVHAQSAHGRA